MRSNAPRHLEAKMANLIKLKKIPALKNMDIVKEEILQLILSTPQDIHRVNVRIGLCVPSLCFPFTHIHTFYKEITLVFLLLPPPIPFHTQILPVELRF